MSLLLVLVLCGGANEPPTDEWLTLDRELERLALVARDEQPVEIGAYVKFSYRASDDKVFRLEPGTFIDQGDMGVFQIDSAALNFRGEVGDFQVKVAFNPVNGKLRSTWARLRPVESVRVTMGHFKVPFLRSRLVSTTRLLFFDRTAQARQTGPRQQGVKVEIELTDDVELTLAAQNGTDQAGEDLVFTGRLEAELLGGGVGKYEGAYGADEPELTLGLAVSNDASQHDQTTLAADLAFTAGRLALYTEVLHYDDGYGPYSTGLLDPFSIIPRADSMPFGVTASWMITPDEWEGAVRLEDFDDPNDTRRWSFGINRYIEGHDAKLVVNWIKVETDNPLLESDVIALGMVVRV